MARYDPFEEMDRMFEQLRTRAWTPEGSLGAGDRSLATGRDAPARKHGDASGNVSMDLTKREDEYVFVADLPGFEKEDIDLELDGDTLAIAAENRIRDQHVTGEGEDAAVAEFTRSRRVAERVTIPEAIVEDEITASYRNGVLEVHLPLVETEADADDAKKIDIRD
ncbi:Hsp20/alpha crystallin family protein [Halorussus salinisoli]|uniref:Hsp20/alpha crystallin family protein n=1 Tax=Halorussus salinisoli TaxID=2558242 RepID=UPI0010C2226B|nr:Hsp20/alpha crystallin family protein [Halorussus salinisoli]